jgi:hypothetical protein
MLALNEGSGFDLRASLAGQFAVMHNALSAADVVGLVLHSRATMRRRGLITLVGPWRKRGRERDALGSPSRCGVVECPRRWK